MVSYKDGPCLTQAAASRQDALWSLVDQHVRSVVTGLLEHVLELEQQEYLIAGWNERKAGRRGYRNGHYRRWLTTPYGRLAVKIPRCRRGGIDCSMLFDRYQRRIGDVDRILRHAYLLGASTRGTAALAEQVFGSSISHQTISRLMRWLDDQLKTWRNASITVNYRVIYIDAMHVDVVGGDRMVMLVAGQRDDGGLDVLGFSVARGEQCKELLADLRSRGLQGVELFVSDAALAIRSGLEQVYPEVAWQSCAFHRLQSLRVNIGVTEYRDLMTAEAGCIFRCPSQQAAKDAAAAWSKRWKPRAPWAVQQFMNGLGDSLMFYNLEKVLWKRTRTNNPLERLIRTLRQRLRPMGCFHDQPAVERAVFGQLLRWHKIRLTHSC